MWIRRKGNFPVITRSCLNLRNELKTSTRVLKIKFSELNFQARLSRLKQRVVSSNRELGYSNRPLRLTLQISKFDRSNKHRSTWITNGQANNRGETQTRLHSNLFFFSFLSFLPLSFSFFSKKSSVTRDCTDRSQGFPRKTWSFGLFFKVSLTREGQLLSYEAKKERARARNSIFSSLSRYSNRERPSRRNGVVRNWRLQISCWILDYLLDFFWKNHFLYLISSFRYRSAGIRTNAIARG